MPILAPDLEQSLMAFFNKADPNLKRQRDLEAKLKARVADRGNLVERSMVWLLVLEARDRSSSQLADL
jgi:hypothetical protein